MEGREEERETRERRWDTSRGEEGKEGRREDATNKRRTRGVHRRREEDDEEEEELFPSFVSSFLPSMRLRSTSRACQARGGG
jgi:hypothetical protein